MTKERQGKCYELAGRFIFNTVDDEARLIHGHVVNPCPDGHRLADLDHAWIEVGEEGKVWEPTTGVWYSREAFHLIFNPTVYAFYTKEQAMKLALQSKHFGPWNVSEQTLDPSALTHWLRTPSRTVSSSSPEDEEARTRALTECSQATFWGRRGRMVVLRTPGGRALLEDAVVGGVAVTLIDYVANGAEPCRRRFWMNRAGLRPMLSTIANQCPEHPVPEDVLLGKV